jgi:hypothetical protein
MPPVCPGLGNGGYVGGRLPAGTAVCSRARVHDEWASWLASFGLDTYVTFTWSDEAGERIGSPYAALRDVKRFLKSMGVRECFLAVEGHKERTIPHVHGVVRFGGDRSFMWAEWFRTRGFARVLPVRDGCESYVTKYLLKEGGPEATWFVLTASSGDATIRPVRFTGSSDDGKDVVAGG